MQASLMKCDSPRRAEGFLQRGGEGDEDEARPEHDAALEAAARTVVPVGDDVEREDLDEGHGDAAGDADDDAVMVAVDVGVGRCRVGGIARTGFVAAQDPEDGEDGHARGEDDDSLEEGVVAPVVARMAVTRFGTRVSR